jgi:transcription initiation factor TFIIIB Brf1 subunit/transcription initiation factor TFIIB
MLMKLHNRQTGSDRQMQAASKEVNEICERLRLPDIVKNSALEVFRDVSGFVLLHALTARTAVP